MMTANKLSQRLEMGIGLRIPFGCEQIVDLVIKIIELLNEWERAVSYHALDYKSTDFDEKFNNSFFGSTQVNC